MSLDGQHAILCRAGNATHGDVKRFVRAARWACKAFQGNDRSYWDDDSPWALQWVPQVGCPASLQAAKCTIWTLHGCKLSDDSKKWLQTSGCRRSILSRQNLRRLSQQVAVSADSSSPDLRESAAGRPLRPCQEACLKACAKGARVIEMACGTGKTRVIKELAMERKGKVGRHGQTSVCLATLIAV